MNYSDGPKSCQPKPSQKPESRPPYPAADAKVSRDKARGVNLFIIPYTATANLGAFIRARLAMFRRGDLRNAATRSSPSIFFGF